MITHTVMWRLRAEDETQRAQRVAAMVEAFEALRGQVPGLLELRVGGQPLDDADGWDIALFSVFESARALALYNEHPKHLAIKAMVKPWREHRAVVDWVD